ncbi:hypothetical protein HUE56_30070 (plasmid) [Azospirillum oryzae]|uniref:Uncharacterized protein n=1 Tax=Azospirillum oryzae TaxID=286727 RepID=A0A6N1ATP8_9PROT|nr:MULTISPECIES: hypothetical protein [Azospirillum]KAA0584257.1 hypothetical protein FZ938_30190 [Azospirillum oryzae]QCG99289.1 hypothetical protein E6C67_36490 [Azospirillum sp. TSA2s]QKS54749.1 hypothetical protein HUE56_30070 [Azospirillum oryzae]GLR83041.1 hypothetical protein GCM10007856_57490 [Azospirillum oryzae]
MDWREAFFKYDYGETKDLLKSFITLVSATLVLSITFSEKIIDIHKAILRVKRMMVAAWVFFIVALIVSGASMCFIAAEAGCVIYGQIPVFACRGGLYALISWALIIISGGCYVIGLVLMALSARAKIMESEHNE